MKMKFGTSGLRGLVTELQGPVAAKYAFSFAQHLLARKDAKVGSPVFIAYDYRPSSPAIAADCVRGLKQAGLMPISCGAIPTPALALYAMSKGCACLMITGSHIPADRNGIKFYRPDGEIDKADELAITQIADATLDENIDVSPIEVSSDNGDAYDYFLARNRTILEREALSGLTIGVYQHSTVARDLLGRVLASYGAEVIPLGHSDTFIPVDTEAVSQDTIDLLSRWARVHALDAIVSADGDGDRPLIADETGTPLRGDLIGLMTARFLNATTLVTPITSNSAIEDAGNHKVLRTKVGSPFVIAAMIEAMNSGADKIIGFEANGGVLTQTEFPLQRGTLSALPTRDSFLPILAALMTMTEQRQSLSQTAASFKLTVALADRLENYPLEKSAALLAYLTSKPENLQHFLAPLGDIQAVDETDGLRATLSDKSVVHLRPSGNAPEMRCYVEAMDAQTATALLKQSLSLVSSWQRP
jgi:phosphomannomutase